MFFRQLVDVDLGCATYLLGDAGRAVVVDPGVDVERLLAAAGEVPAQIEAVLETHVHADHVSGRALLAARTGARVRVPAGAGVAPAAGSPLRAGDVVRVGAVRIDVLAAPGHRPEHLALLVTDEARCPDPCMLLSGDSLLVGDLARPDLAIDGEEGARVLHGTLTRLQALGDAVELWPGHVGGSLCGGASLSPRFSSTLGYERRANALLRVADRAAFAAQLLDGLPERPPTVEHVVARNRTPAPAPGPAPRLGAAALAAALDDGAALVDGRPAAAFDGAHLPGSLNIPLERPGVGTFAAFLLDPTQQLVAFAAEERDARELARRLQAVGFERVRGIAAGETHATLRAAGRVPAAVASLASDALEAGPRAPTLLDVRDDDEWRADPRAGALHVPLARLRERVGALPPGPLAVVCASGRRAAVAASWLRRAGRDARRVAGEPVAAERRGAAAVMA